MRYHYTTSNCLKPQSLFRSALSPSRASSPAARFQWTDVDTPERYPAIHFKNGHVTCYVMLGHIRLYYNHEAMSNAVKRCQMLQTQNSWHLEKSFVFRCFQINWSTPLKTLTQSCVQGRPGIARVTCEKKINRILRWKLFPVDQWIGWGGKNIKRNHPETMEFTMEDRGLLQNCDHHPTKKVDIPAAFQCHLVYLYICKGCNKIDKSVDPTFLTLQNILTS